ncbi:MAG: hemolysin family protein [Gammaproteobacteria bacterium]|jgi:CBS domain containing-hemolysin-like protein
MDSLLILLVMVPLMLLQGFFSGSEIALVNADKFKMKHLASLGNKGAQLYMKMFQRPEVILGTTLVGTNISIVALTTLATLLMIQLFGAYGDLLAFIIFTPLFLVFGEVVPKSVYQQKANVLAPIVIFPLRLFSLLFYPLVFIFSHLARFAARLVGVKPSHGSLFITREQVRMILEDTEAMANVDVFDRDRLIRAVRFAETTVADVMIPIAEVSMLSHRQSIDEAIMIARQHGYFRLPVYEDEPGNILGVVVLSIWELMDPQLKSKSVEQLRTPVCYVVENQPVDEILDELQQRDDHMAIVVDEFGSAMGIITLEDVLERVVGDVINIGYSYEAYIPRHKGKIEKLGTERYRIDGRVLVSDVANGTGILLTDTMMHTIGGVLMHKLRHLPRPGESVIISGYRFIADEVTEKAVQSIIVEPE